MMKLNEALGYQRKVNDRDNTTGFRRADTFLQRVGTVVCSVLALVCMTPGIVRGISSICSVASGNKDNNSDRDRYQEPNRVQREKRQNWQQ